jgi:IrrE N-terminal-like domain
MNLPVIASQISVFKRGFKTWAENTSASVRTRLRLPPYAPLSPDALAEHLKVRIWTPDQVPGIKGATVDYLASEQGDEWSAIAMHFGSIDVVVVNARHEPARRASDLMHEISHILCKHESARIFISETTGARVRTFDERQEAEADWLAGCLLLPRPALVYCASQRLSEQAVLEKYGVSVEMYTYRRNITGVSRQFR